MFKDFYKWHHIKEKVHNLSNKLSFKEGDIWWTYQGVNVGQEQDGKGDLYMRPVLIFKKFNENLCWAIPLSTKVTPKGSFFFPLLSESNIIRTAILPQMRVIDSKRLGTKLDQISRYELTLVKEKIIAFIQ